MSVDEYSKYLADVDLGQFFEDLLRDDRNTVDLDLDTGCRTRKGGATDCSAGPLIKSVGEDIWRRPVYKRLRYLYNNYEESVKTSEDRTSFERREEQNFLTEIMKTNTMKTTLMFLKAKGLFTKSESEFKKLLSQLWFDIYSRGQRIQSSSGFEHVFMGEKKDGKVQGFHNWAFFYDQEQKHQVNIGKKTKKIFSSRSTILVTRMCSALAITSSIFSSPSPGAGNRKYLPVSCLDRLQSLRWRCTRPVSWPRVRPAGSNCLVRISLSSPTPSSMERMWRVHSLKFNR